ncbi:SDR family oxidoreductase [uncultured Demequina sp.]|uniref:SDR family oxidoreductase n=1 Tax=uncultured Demequina sp. TaxID=693499 RepID=UPI0025CBD75C|nr:SDR family oxidoreductase [uncultured Demequina sp.]
MRGTDGLRRFDGTVTVLTGASRGIGLAIAQRLVDEGGSVIITGRKQDSLDAAVEALGGQASAIAGRADDAEHRDAVIAHAIERHGRLDHLVNNAGINPVYGPIVDIDAAAARKIIDVNLLAMLGWARAAVAAGLAGSIVNVASVAGLASSPGIGFYGISKAAVINLTMQLSHELAPAIRVNAVAPAVVKTDFARALYEADEAGAAAAYPLARLGEVEDVAGPVAFLLSSDAAWITGVTLPIDGGAGVRPFL